MRVRAFLILLAILIVGTVLFTLFNNYIYYQKNNPNRVPIAPKLILNSRPRFPISYDPTWTLLLTGDIIPARSVNYQMTQKNDFMWPLKNIASILRNADITLINLEAPLIENCPITNEGMTFCGDSRFAKSLSEAGVDVANLANNHSLNHGWLALTETERHLKENGIESTGFSTDTDSFFETQQCPGSVFCSRFVIKQITPPGSNYEFSSANLHVGFLGYNAVGQDIDRERIKSEITTANSVVDVLIVSVHWGKEYTRVPETDGIAPHDPKELGRLFIDSGADVVAGNHPHWYQGIEWYQNKPIIYAQGNTVFDQEWSPETKVGYLAKLTFNGRELNKTIEIIPIGLRNYGEAYLLEGKEAQSVKEYVLQKNN